MLANRFLINLRSISDRRGTTQSSFHTSRFSIPNFHIPDNILGNIGESLRDGDDGDDDVREQDVVVDDTFLAEIDAQNSAQSGFATSVKADSAAPSVVPKPSSSVV